VALLALLPALAGCAGRGGTTADGAGTVMLPEPDPRDLPPWLRRPATERPPWLRDLPAEIERIRLPDDGFRANLG
jgi:hypothetical protein